MSPRAHSVTAAFASLRAIAALRAIMAIPAITAITAMVAVGASPAAATPYNDNERVQFTGVVSDPAGKPVPGAQVVVEVSRRYLSLRQLRRAEKDARRVGTSTNAQGEYSIEWPWDGYFNHFQLLAGVSVRHGKEEHLEVLESEDVTERVLAGSPVVSPIEIHDRGVVDRLDAAHHVGGIDRRAVDQHVLRQLLAARPGALQRHQQPGLHLRLGARQLGRGEAVGKARGLLAQYRQQLGRLLFAGAGIDAEQPAVAIAMREGMDRIDEAALLAHLLEQAGRHAAAERGRQHGCRVIIGVAER